MKVKYLSSKSVKHKYNMGHKTMSINGITLISLIITVILLIILAGVVINLSIGENGLFNKAKQTKERYNEIQAKEKLETILAKALIEKETNTKYNNEDFLDDILTGEDILVNKNTVNVDNYNFLIDREKLKIVESLGETTVKVINEVQEYLGKNENDKYMVSSLVTIQSNIEIENIKIINPDGTNIVVTTDKQELAKDINMELDQEYRIEIKTKDGKTDTKIIIERSEENVRTEQELAVFRDKVNSGLTYEGKTIKVINDLDLSSVCGNNVDGQEKSWVSIGNSETTFKGTFDGQNNKIENIYINVNQGHNGLFGFSSGIIQNVSIYGSITNTAKYGNYTAGIVVLNSGTVKQCINNVKITSSGPTGGIVAVNDGTIVQCANKEQLYATNGNNAGIAGINRGEIKECYNTGSINSPADSCVGGIVGSGANMIYNCYNRGEIIAKSTVGGITGVVNGSYRPGGVKYTYNSYNIGSISGSSYVGQITGRDNYECTSRSINCYTTDATANKLNAGEYSDNVWIDDGKKIDKDGNIVDNLDDDGNIKYINDKYPILKWQVQE